MEQTSGRTVLILLAVASCALGAVVGYVRRMPAASESAVTERDPQRDEGTSGVLAASREATEQRASLEAERARREAHLQQRLKEGPRIIRADDTIAIPYRLLDRLQVLVFCYEPKIDEAAFAFLSIDRQEQTALNRLVGEAWKALLVQERKHARVTRSGNRLTVAFSRFQAEGGQIRGELELGIQRVLGGERAEAFMALANRADRFANAFCWFGQREYRFIVERTAEPGIWPFTRAFQYLSKNGKWESHGSGTMQPPEFPSTARLVAYAPDFFVVEQTERGAE
jgi:hypothetical protein